MSLPAFTERSVLVLGCEGTGKTLLVRALNAILDDPRKGKIFNLKDTTTSPTVGVEIDKVTVNNLSVTLKEVGGSMIPTWPSYYGSTDLILYVMDASNPHQLSASCVELWEVLGHADAAKIPILLVISKCDLPNLIPRCHLRALTMLDCSGPALPGSRGSRVTAQETSAMSGLGLREVLGWIEKTPLKGEVEAPLPTPPPTPTT